MVFLIVDTLIKIEKEQILYKILDENIDYRNVLER